MMPSVMILALAALAGAFPQPALPPSATLILEDAKARAAAGQRNIFLIFSASW